MPRQVAICPVPARQQTAGVLYFRAVEQIKQSNQHISCTLVGEATPLEREAQGTENNSAPAGGKLCSYAEAFDRNCASLFV